MASRNRDERAYVNELIKVLLIETQKLYVYIDRDCGSLRHTSSGWDFQLSLNNLTIYCEAKIEAEKLTTWQEFTRAKIRAAGSKYHIIRFYDDGQFFTVNGGKKIAISAATFNDFIQG